VSFGYNHPFGDRNGASNGIWLRGIVRTVLVGSLALVVGTSLVLLSVASYPQKDV